MNKMSVYAGAILCCVVAGSLSFAEPARHYISYTKRNTLSSPATATLRFSLWDAPTNGVEVWSEEKLVTMTVPGIRVALGDVTPLDTVDFSRQLWVQVELKRRLGQYVVMGARDLLPASAYAAWAPNPSIITDAYITAIGLNAFTSNTMGTENTASGDSALYYNTTGTANTAIGYWTLRSNTTGTHNTAMGWGAGVGLGIVTNATAIGYKATVEASNKVVIGNSDVTSIGGYADWTSFSDRRFEENIVYTNGLGLDFVEKLRTVSFTYRADQNKRRRDGLIAQDVEQALADLGLEFSELVIDEDKDGTMNLSYGEFVVPLINAVKELSKQNQDQAQQINDLKDRLAKLEAVLNK
jgi:hypothetical protein